MHTVLAGQYTGAPNAAAAAAEFGGTGHEFCFVMFCRVLSWMLVAAETCHVSLNVKSAGSSIGPTTASARNLFASMNSPLMQQCFAQHVEIHLFTVR